MCYFSIKTLVAQEVSLILRHLSLTSLVHLESMAGSWMLPVIACLSRILMCSYLCYVVCILLRYIVSAFSFCLGVCNKKVHIPRMGSDYTIYHAFKQ